jgi:hypothetical protein
MLSLHALLLSLPQSLLFGINRELTQSSLALWVYIIACLITTLFATDFFEIKAVDEIGPALKKQLIIHSAVMTVGIPLVSWLGLPYMEPGSNRLEYIWKP